MVIAIGNINLNLQIMIFKIWLKKNRKNRNNKIMNKNKVIYEKIFKLIISKIY
jgi:hypothetical protein